MGVLDTIDEATPSRRDVPLILKAGLQAEYDALLERLDQAATEDARSGSIGKPSGAFETALDELDARREEIKASRVTFRLERIDWSERLTLQAEHPPRKDNMADQIRGYNLETFTPVLIRASIVSLIGSDGEEVPAADVSEERWAHLLGEPGKPGVLNTKAIGDLWQAADFVNDGASTVPPSARSLRVSQDSGASLGRPSPGTSPRGGGAAGSRPTSPKSSGTKKARSKARSAGT